MKTLKPVVNEDDSRHLFAEWAEGFQIFARHADGQYYDVSLEHDRILVHIKRLSEKETARLRELGWSYSAEDKGYVRYG